MDLKRGKEQMLIWKVYYADPETGLHWETTKRGEPVKKKDIEPDKLDILQVGIGEL